MGVRRRHRRLGPAGAGAGDGTVTPGTYPETARLEGGYSILEVPDRDAALAWAARFAAACRCAQEVREFGDDPDS